MLIIGVIYGIDFLYLQIVEYVANVGKYAQLDVQQSAQGGTLVEDD